MTTSSHDRRWRPKASGQEPVCGAHFRDLVCDKRGPHYCEPRAERVVTFFETHLRHTKGPKARTPFVLAPWQADDIIRPLFGEVSWSVEWQRYIRRFRLAYIVLPRKNGKSELAAGIALVLTVGDDEEAAEVYGAAKDTKQASKVFDPALRMTVLNKNLGRRLKHNKVSRRLYDEKSWSHYEVITADAAGELGHNPHGFILDEVLSQPDGKLWEALVTGQGARAQPLFLAITTETDKAASFGADLIDEAEVVMYDPARTPHIFAYVRRLPGTPEHLEELRRHHKGHPDLPISCDVFDERNWAWPNPALDDFKSRATMREMALEAKLDPMKENSFRQFQMNQRVQQATRWMPMHLYTASAGNVWLNPDSHREQFRDQVAFCGLDLAAKFDLTAWCVVVPDEEDACDVFWRFWLPEAAADALDRQTEGRISEWARDGWITLTEGEVIEYADVYEGIGEDADHYAIRGGGADRWSMMPVIQEVAKRTSLPVNEALMLVEQTYKGMTPGMVYLMELVRQGRFRHHQNPVAAWCFDNVEVRKAPYDPEQIRPHKPDRSKTGVRIDAVTAAAMAVDAWRGRGIIEPQRSAYEDHDVMVI